MAMSIFRRFSICSSSLVAYWTRVSLLTPSTRSATVGENSLAMLLVGGGGILDGVVQQGRHDGLCVQVQLLRHDLCHRQGM